MPVMREQGNGHIINIWSIGGLVGIPFESAYCTSKAAVQIFTEILRMEVKPFGIKVSVVDPGDYNTGFTKNRQKSAASAFNPVYRKKFQQVSEKESEFEMKNKKTEKVAILLYRILKKRNPKLRYLVAPPVELLAVRLKHILPSGIYEKIIMKNFGI